MAFHSPYLTLLKNRIDMRGIPFTDRSSRILVSRSGESFSVRLAERWLKLNASLTAYRDRPPMIDKWVLTDGEGAPLDLNMTTYPHGVECATSAGLFTLSFYDPETLVLTLPHGRCGIRFEAGLDQARTDRRGGVLRMTGDVRRNVAYTTDARILRNETVARDARIQVVTLLLDASEGNRIVLLNITPRLGFNRYITAEAVGAMQDSARRWHDWFAAAPPVADEYRRQYYYAWWVMRAGLLSSRFYMTREAMAPSLSHYVGVWQWDAYFHALAYRHVDMRLAQDQFRIMLDHQRDDGMIPDAVHDEGMVTHLDYPVDADVTKPPVMAWAAWKLYEQDGDAEFINEIYEAAVRWNRWWFEYNDVDHDGLCEYIHPYSSGLDDSPLWDEGMPVESPDLNTYLVLQQDALARMARVIGEEVEAERWEQRAADLTQLMIQNEWDAKSGLFWARRQAERINVRTPFGLFPLLTGRLPGEISRCLVDRLKDEKQFWPRYPVPTVALDDPTHDPNRMWRGPVWINVNYLLVEGLQRSGYPDVARELRRRTLELVCQHEDIYEYYHPQTGERPPRAAATYGWSAAMFIDLAIQAARQEGR